MTAGALRPTSPRCSRRFEQSRPPIHGRRASSTTADLRKAGFDFLFVHHADDLSHRRSGGRCDPTSAAGASTRPSSTPLHVWRPSPSTGLRGDRLAGATLVGPWGGADAKLASPPHSTTSRVWAQPTRPRSDRLPPASAGWISIVVGAHLQVTAPSPADVWRPVRARHANRGTYARLPTTPAQARVGAGVTGGVPIDLEVWSLSPAFGGFMPIPPVPVSSSRRQLRQWISLTALAGARYDISSAAGANTAGRPGMTERKA